MSVIFEALSIAYILEAWLNTDVFLEYMRLFFLTRFFYLNEYLKDFYGHMSYIEYLVEHRNCFFVRLISCPTCLSFWLSLIISILLGNVVDCLAIAFLSLIFYKCHFKLTYPA